jgi:hypothetical protein
LKEINNLNDIVFNGKKIRFVKFENDSINEYNQISRRTNQYKIENIIISNDLKSIILINKSIRIIEIKLFIFFFFLFYFELFYYLSDFGVKCLQLDGIISTTFLKLKISLIQLIENYVDSFKLITDDNRM